MTEEAVEVSEGPKQQFVSHLMVLQLPSHNSECVVDGMVVDVNLGKSLR